MNTELILIEEYCKYSSVETTFIQSLQEVGLIEIVEIEQQCYILNDQLSDVQKYSEWHYELNISAEGIDAIQHLLNRMTNMQQEIEELKGRLRLFE